MIEKTGAIDVYFEDEIQILIADPDDFPVETLEGVLEANGVKYEGIATSPNS